MKLDKLVEFGDLLNFGQFHFDRANGFGSNGRLYYGRSQSIASVRIVWPAKSSTALHFTNTHAVQL
jgi:hypothetical protein